MLFVSYKMMMRQGIIRSKNMASIFASVAISIIAKQRNNAGSGLRGLRDISKPKHFVQYISIFEKGSSMITTQRQNEGQSP